MLSTKKILLVFLPALLLGAFVLFIRFIQYEPLYPDVTTEEQKDTQFIIPIFEEDPIMGSKKAPLTIIAFEDFSCPACKMQDGFLQELLSAYPDKIKIIWKGLPVASYPYDSRQAHQYAYCAAQQKKFLEFKQQAFAQYANLSASTLDTIANTIGLNSDDLKSCISLPQSDTAITRIEQLATILQIQNVPTFFVDNKQIETPETLEAWKKLLQL